MGVSRGFASLSALTRRFGVTPRAIRYYEEAGLIAAERDPMNARRFDGEQQERLAEIVRLRRAGLSLNEVRSFFSLRDDADGGAENFVLERLAARRDRLLAELETVEQAMGRLDAPAARRLSPAVHSSNPAELSAS